MIKCASPDFLDLPHDLLRLVLERLDARSLCAAEAACRTLRAAAASAWNAILAKRFPVTANAERNAKTAYVVRAEEERLV
eukprot:tig00021796_g23546.t1